MNELEILGILMEAADAIPDGMLKHVINDVLTKADENSEFTEAIHVMAEKKFETPVEVIAFFSHCVLFSYEQMTR